MGNRYASCVAGPSYSPKGLGLLGVTWPGGDPGRLEALAANLSRSGSRQNRVASELAAVTRAQMPTWVGEGKNFMLDRATDQIQHIRSTVHTLLATSKIVAGFAAELDRIQSQLAKWSHEAEEADRARQRHQTALALGGSLITPIGSDMEREQGLLEAANLEIAALKAAAATAVAAFTNAAAGRAKSILHAPPPTSKGSGTIIAAVQNPGKYGIDPNPHLTKTNGSSMGQEFVSALVPALDPDSSVTANVAWAAAQRTGWIDAIFRTEKMTRVQYKQLRAANSALIRDFMKSEGSLSAPRPDLKNLKDARVASRETAEAAAKFSRFRTAVKVGGPALVLVSGFVDYLDGEKPLRAAAKTAGALAGGAAGAAAVTLTVVALGATGPVGWAAILIGGATFSAGGSALGAEIYDSIE